MDSPTEPDMLLEFNIKTLPNQSCLDENNQVSAEAMIKLWQAIYKHQQSNILSSFAHFQKLRSDHYI